MAKITTITNPLTGQPAQVDQLDHTAQQIDDGLNIARNVSNPNLLDNWYFANCVDQRQGRIVKPNTTYYSDNQLTTAAGTTSAYVTAYRYATGTANGVNYAAFKLEDTDAAPTYYAAPENVVRGYVGGSYKYTIDRYRFNDGTNNAILINDGYITFTDIGTREYKEWSELVPNYKDLIGKTMTYSALVRTNTPECKLFYSWKSGESVKIAIPSDGKWRLVTTTAVIPDNATNVTRFGFQIMTGYSGSVDIKAAKLELGNQQTLAHQDENGNWVLNEIPDYGEQLRRCQRYLRPLIDSAWGDCAMPVKFNASKTRCYLYVDMRLNPMRTTPVAVVIGSGNVRVVGTNSAGVETVVSINIANTTKSGGCNAQWGEIRLDGDFSVLNTTINADADLLGANGKILLSAEL